MLVWYRTSGREAVCISEYLSDVSNVDTSRISSHLYLQKSSEVIVRQQKSTVKTHTDLDHLEVLVTRQRAEAASNYCPEISEAASAHKKNRL